MGYLFGSPYLAVERSVAESSQDALQQGMENQRGNPSTAFEIAKIEQNAATVLGFSMKFTAQSAINVGYLLISDILQYLTIAQAQKITADEGLLYRTFLQKEPGDSGKTNKIKFDVNLPETIDEDIKMEMSFKILMAQGGIRASTRLFWVNPIMFRDFNYKLLVDADVLNPRSADLERAFDLETYDRAIASPVADQERLYKDLLMASNPKTSRDPGAYVIKQPVVAQEPDVAGQSGRPSPVAAISGANPLNK